MINISQVKKDVIEHIKSLKYTGKYTKVDIIATFRSFKKEDFCCFAEDGDTYIMPKQYYNAISIDRAKKELKSIDMQFSFHTIDEERGVNLLNCCGRCRDLFLENLFKEKILKSLIPSKEMK